jgi:GNAT superfamily N-acetyltransferase
MVEEHAMIDPIYTLREGGENEALVHFGNMMSDENRLLIVVEDSNRIAGYLAASTRTMPPVFERQRIGLISELCVSPTMRRHGIGRSLFEHARDWFLQNGIKRIEVRTLIGNQESTAFWKNLGFEAYSAEYHFKAGT